VKRVDVLKIFKMPPYNEPFFLKLTWTLISQPTERRPAMGISYSYWPSTLGTKDKPMCPRNKKKTAGVRGVSPVGKSRREIFGEMSL